VISSGQYGAADVARILARAFREQGERTGALNPPGDDAAVELGTRAVDGCCQGRVVAKVIVQPDPYVTRMRALTGPSAVKPLEQLSLAGSRVPQLPSHVRW